MSSVRIHGAEFALSKIFSNDFAFSIPMYQRPYRWQPDQARELLDDLLNGVESHENVPIDDLEPYFLGSIVLIKKQERPEAEVVDGQQRLTTLTILLASMRIVLSADYSKHLREYIFQQGNVVEGTPDRPRLTVRERDKDFFVKYVQKDGGLEELFSLDPANLSDSCRCFQNNARLFVDRLRDLPQSCVQRLASFVAQKCFLVAVSTPDLNSAYRIFSVLNERGLDLSHSDILKSEILGRVNDQEHYNRLWEEAEEKLGSEKFGELFGHIRMIYARTKNRESVLQGFRNEVISRVADPKSLIEKVLGPHAETLATITSESYSASTGAEEVNQILAWLNRIEWVDWIPVALEIFRLHQRNSRLLARRLAQLERVAASLFIRRSYINQRIDRFAVCLKALAEDHAVDEAFELSADEKRETVERLNADLYMDTKTRLYVLLRLDSALSSGGAKYDYNIITVEHVLPQTPDAESQWVRDFSSEERASWTHRLGNLLLLSKRKNSEAQNYDFQKKKERYFGGKSGVSPFALTSQVLRSETWTVPVLQSRQRILLEKLSEIWELG